MERHNITLEMSITEPLNRKLSDYDAEMKVIVDFVENYRNEKDIVPTPGVKPELSSMVYGEGYNLLYRQLILTTNGHDGWLELEDTEVRNLVLNQIKKDRAKYKF